MKTLLMIYITNEITICNNGDLEMESFYLCVFIYNFPSFIYLLMNIHLYVNEIIFMWDHWMKGLVILYYI